MRCIYLKIGGFRRDEQLLRGCRALPFLRLAVVLVLMCSWGIGRVARGQLDSASFAELIALVQNADRGLRNVEYDVEFVNGSLAPGDGVWELHNQSASRFRAFLRKDVGSERFLADYSAVTPYRESPAKATGTIGYLRSVGGASFDGASYCEWQRAAPANRADPQEGYGEGLIDGSQGLHRPSAFRSAFGNTAGLRWVPPTFYVHPDSAKVAESLSSFLVDAAEKGLSISIEKSGELSIVRVVGVQLPDEFPVTVEIHWHREMAGIVEQRWYYDIDGKQETLQHARMRLRKIEGRGFPEEVALVAFGTETNDMARWQFTDYRVNKTVAQSDFRVPFPANIHLVDHFHSRLYLTGASPIDEQKAVQDYARRFPSGRAALEDPEATGRVPTRMKWLLWVNVTIFCTLLLSILVRRFFRRRASLGLILAFVAAAPTSAGSPIEQHIDASASEVLDLSRVSRCGLRATYFVLEYFAIDYDPLLVSEALPFHVDGASLAEIAAALEAHGLRVDLRKGVTVPELATSITASRLAVFPIEFRAGVAHFLVACAGSGDRLFVVDPPRAEFPLATGLSPNALDQTDGCVLFVSRDHSVQGREIKLTVEPDIIDFGVVEIDGQNSGNAMARRIAIRNDGHRAIAVSRVASSCGCARADWVGGVLQPGEQHEIVFTLVPAAWGQGHHSKQAFLQVVGAASPVQLSVQATGVLSEKP